VTRKAIEADLAKMERETERLQLERLQLLSCSETPSRRLRLRTIQGKLIRLDLDMSRARDEDRA